MAKEKVQITMDADLLKDVDEYCDKNYMNRSWMISQACLQMVNQQKLVDAICSMSLAIKKCAESGEMDENAIREMEQFEAISKMFIK